MDHDIHQPIFIFREQNHDQTQSRMGQQILTPKPVGMQRQSDSEQQHSTGSATEFGDSCLLFGTSTEQSSLPRNEVYDSSALTCGHLGSIHSGPSNSKAAFGSSCGLLPYALSSEVQESAYTSTCLVQGPDLEIGVESLTQAWNHGPYDRYLDLDLDIETEAYRSSRHGNLQAAFGTFEPLTGPWTYVPLEPFSTEAVVWPAYMNSSITIKKNDVRSYDVTQYRDLCPRSETSSQHRTQGHTIESSLGPVQSGTQVPRRQKITRKTGRACLLCGLEKAKCNATDDHGPCNGCFKRALFNESLARRLCFQFSVKIWEFRQTVENFRQASKNKSQHILSDLKSHGRRRITIHPMPAFSEIGLCFSQRTITLEVEDIDPDSFSSFVESQKQEPEAHKMSVIMDALTAPSLSPTSPCQHCYVDTPNAIAKMKEPGGALHRLSEESLRVLRERLLVWSLEDLCFRSHFPPQTDEDALDFFLLAFVKHVVKRDPSHPMKNIAKTTLIAMTFARHMSHPSIVEIPRNSPADVDGPPEFARLPKPARAQILAIGLQQAQAFEASVLKEMDSMIFSKPCKRAWDLRPSCADPLVLGLCIRRITLWYRGLMFRYKGFGAQTEDRYLKARKLYDAMVRIYRHAFRGTLSPFDEDWNSEQHASTLGNDPELINRFEAFKATERNQCQRLHPEDDALFLSLIIRKKN